MDESTTTILIVDDDPGIRLSFADYLEDRDYRVLRAENGRIGLETFIREKPDLVLLDLRMPEMDGLELLRRIRETRPDTPLIVVSGTGRICDAIEALRLGAWDYLLKPVNDLSALEHTVEQSLERARLLRENREYQESLESQVHARTIELEHANERLFWIAETTSSLSSCLDLKQFGSRLLEEFGQRMNATDGSLYLLENDSLRLVHAIAPGHSPEVIPFPIPEGTVLSRIIQEKHPLLVEEVNKLNELTNDCLTGYSAGSALVFPIADERGRVAAVLSLHSRNSPPFCDQDKEIGAILASYSGESLRATRTFEALSESERRFRGLANMLPQAICETDHTGTITYGNRKAFESFGYSIEELTSGLKILNMIAPHDRERAASNAMKVLRNGEERTAGTEYTAVRKDGSCFPVLVYSTPIMEGGEPAGMRVVVVDITVRKQQEELILHHAHFDNLTDLPNRFLALDRLTQLIKEAKRTGKRIAVLFLDLDDFKRINDALGHETGDKLLVQVAERLTKTVRDGDTIGRLGGDEFILLLGSLAEAADARPVAENLLNRFRKAFRLDNLELVLTASFGISIYPDDGDTPAELLRKADTAMYYAKGQGRNTYHYFTDTMNQDVSRRLMLEQHLHGALGRGEFYLRYQPQVKISNRAVIGFEALLRWNNPVMGNISPAEFIPIAEQTGLIVPIGRYVLTEALITAARWQKRHRQAFKIAVNLSPRQFRDPKLRQQIEDTLQQADVPYDSLVLEITEGVLMSGQSDIDDALSALSDMGVGIAMDDFGTGYSSLSYLRKYPFNILKIDRSFVNDITVDPGDRELVNAAIAMARGLGLKVIAEGVETEEQLQHLAEFGCEFAQGYLFSMPLSPEQLSEMLEQQDGTIVSDSQPM